MALVNTKAIVWLAAAILVVDSSGRTLSAQTREATDSSRKPVVPAAAFCIRGLPIRECRSFAIIELPIGARVAHTLRSDNSGVADVYVGLELGGMVNRSETRAIGGTVLAAYSGGDSHFSVSARSRTWFSGKSYRDASLGLLATGTSGKGTAYGLTSTVGSGYSDLIGVWVGADVGLIGPHPRASLQAGGRLGSYATLSLIGLAVALAGLAGINGGFHGDT